MTKFLGSLGLILLTACSGGGDGGDGGTPTPPPTPTPQAVTLLFPDNNSTCIEGIVVGPNDNQLTFQWNEGQNTDSYTLVVKNLFTQAETQKESSTNSASLLLKRGTPYQWYVISKAQGTTTTASSATWKFFNAGEGITNYAPFPADAIYPARGAQISSTESVTLEWDGADVDDDILGYEVYLDTSSDLTIEPASTSESTLEVAVTAGQTYYWKVITLDSAGNSSDSEIFEFSVQ